MSHYDVIVIGSGAGGGTLVHRLAPSGKRVLLLERGDWLPREPQNWSAADVFVDNRYVSPDTWYDEHGKAFQPQTVRAHTHPVPPLALGPWLQRHGYATAAQDLSDSLSQVALQLAAASGAAIELDFRGYKFAAELREYAESNSVKTTLAELLLAQAEDYELLFTVAPEHADALQDAPVPLTRLGRVVAASERCNYIDEHGQRHALTATGFEHLGEDK
jgi:thiamine monophosphate kinase